MPYRVDEDDFGNEIYVWEDEPTYDPGEFSPGPTYTPAPDPGYDPEAPYANLPGGGGGYPGVGGRAGDFQPGGKGWLNDLGKFLQNLGLDARTIGSIISSAAGVGVGAYAAGQNVPDIQAPPWNPQLDPTQQMYLGAGSAPFDRGQYDPFFNAGAAPMPTDIGGFDWRRNFEGGTAPVRNQEWNDRFAQAMAWPGAEQIVNQIGQAQGLDWGPGYAAAGQITGAGDPYFAQAAGLAGGAPGIAQQEGGYAAPDLYRPEEAALIERMMVKLREDPAMQLRHNQARAALRDTAYQQMGEGWETSTAGIRMAQELERRIDDELYAREKGDVEQSMKAGELVSQFAGRRAESSTAAARVRQAATAAAAQAAVNAAEVMVRAGASKADAAAKAAQVYATLLSNQGELAWRGVSTLGGLQDIYQRQQLAGLTQLREMGESDRAAQQWGVKSLGDIAAFNRAGARWGADELQDIWKGNQEAARWGFQGYTGEGARQQNMALEIAAANTAKALQQKRDLLGLSGQLTGRGATGLTRSTP